MPHQIITTVATAATSTDLTTLAAVKAELDIQTGGQDDILKRYIASASAAVAQHCNRVFPVESLVDRFVPVSDSSRGLLVGPRGPLQLSRWPIVDVTSVTEDGSALAEDSDFIGVERPGQLIRLDGDRAKSWSNTEIEVTYSAGYATIPSDLEDAVIRMVTKRYSAKGRDPNLKQQNIPGVLEQSWWIATGSQAGNMTPDIVDILEAYRVPVVA